MTRAVRRSLVAVLASALALAASPAAATPTFSILWQDTGTSSIAVSTTVSQVIVADIVLELGAGDSLSLVSGALAYDEDFADELDFLTFREHRVDVGGGAFAGPINPGPNLFSIPSASVFPPIESTATSAGLADGFEIVGPGTPGLVSGPILLTIGTAVFRTNPSNVATDGVDLRFTIPVNGLDGYVWPDGELCNDATPCPFTFMGASVNAPEPTTATLLVAGLALGAWAGRGRTRR